MNEVQSNALWLSKQYDNSQYWNSLHKNFSGSLRAVGWPGLSEAFNELKYQSEADSILSMLGGITATCLANQYRQLSVLEVGVGIGYWAETVPLYLKNQGIEVDLTCLDISATALEVVKTRSPRITTVQADLKQIDTNSYARQFDLVHALAVLHHLKHLQDVLNGLLFCARSTADNGHLLIYDPILTLDYSPFNTIEWSTFAGNGVPHRLAQVDDVLLREGFMRRALLPGASFILNSPLEAHNRRQFQLISNIWRLLRKYIYHSETRTKHLSRSILAMDRFLKRRGLAFSATVVVYSRQPGA